MVDDRPAGADIFRGRASSPAANQHVAGVLLAPAMLLARLILRWRRSRAA